MQKVSPFLWFNDNAEEAAKLLHHEEPATGARVMQAKMKMGKLDIAALKRAAEQV